MRRLGGCLVLIASACGDPEPLAPRGQTLLYVMTDAPLPPPASVLQELDEPAPLFDRARIQIFEPGQGQPCTGCDREIPLDRELVARGASIGIEQRVGEAGYRARVRLFRGIASVAGEPDPNGAVDVTVALPVIEEEGIREATVLLPTGAVGAPRGTLDAPEPFEPGPPSSNLVGTWPGARRVPCTREPDPDEVCVPGGAYWMGTPVENATSELFGGSDELRLVVLSPFLLNRTEITVAQMRSFTQTQPLSGLGHWSGGLGGATMDDFCTYVETGERNTFPVNCISWEAAREYCQARGSDLPTEAQHEYVSGALESSLYVWGEDEPVCKDAVFGRGGIGILETYEAPCRKPGDPGGALPVGSGGRDRLPGLSGGELLDLAGNVAEWALDRFATQDASCWPSGVLLDPLCASETPTVSRSVRGGSFTQEPVSLRAATKHSHHPGPDISVGFRCARSGT